MIIKIIPLIAIIINIIIIIGVIEVWNMRRSGWIIIIVFFTILFIRNFASLVLTSYSIANAGFVMIKLAINFLIIAYFYYQKELFK